MSLVLGTNIASLRAQRQLFNADRELSSVFERLSSGQRINKAGDDAAGLAVSESLRVDRRVFNQGIRNLNDGISALNQADGAIAALTSVIVRIEELAEQSLNGVYSAEQRQALDAEAQVLSDEFSRIVQSTNFNDLNLLRGDGDNLRFQGGYGVDGGILSGVGGGIGTGTLSQTDVLSPNTRDVVLGDLNTDGNLDYVDADGNIYLGDGEGGFSVGDPLGFTGREVALDDLNNDGVLDIVIAGSSASRSFLGDGDGTFSNEQVLSDGLTLTYAVEIGDLNGDGILDLALGGRISSSASIEVQYGNGDGTFQTGITQTLSAGTSTQTLDLSDLDGDGDLDIFVASSSAASRVINGGDGDFSDEATIELSSAEGITSGDFNGDGIIDFAYGRGAGGVRVYTGDGTGSFTLSDSLNLGVGNTNDVQAGDINGDGLLDLVSGGTNSGGQVTVFLGAGDGTFTEATTQSADATAVEGIALGDINNDGVLDIVSAGADTRAFASDTIDGVSPILEFSLETLSDARQALPILQRKRELLSEQRGEIGAFQSRLQTAVSVLGATSENYAAAESRIRDADIAEEGSKLVRLNILQQAAAAVLTQANQQPALAISLLS